MGKSILTSLIMLVAVGTPASAETTNPIFLDCYVNQTVSKPGKDDEKIPSGNIYYKIDIQNSDVSRLDKDDGKYKTLCSDLKKPRVFGTSQGWCTITEDHVTASGDQIFLGYTAVEYLSLYRYSGKISTRITIYSGLVENRLKPEYVTHRLETEGTCKQGTDMSLKTKAF
jgi:hypothetical protein